MDGKLDVEGAPVANATDSGVAVVNNYQVPESVARPFMWMLSSMLIINLVIAITSLVVSLVGAPMLMAKAEGLSDKSTELSRDLFQVSYWSQRVEVAAEKQGIKIPPAPQFDSHPRKE